MSGRLAYRIEGSPAALEASAGQLVALPRGVVHELVRTSPDLTLWVLELASAAEVPWLAEPCVLAPAEAWRKPLLAAVRKLWLRPSASVALQLQARSWQALHAVEVDTVASGAHLHPAVAQAKLVCEALGEQRLDISGLARQAGLSSSRLSHLFAEQLGLTPLQYRNFARVQHFIQTYDGDERNLLRAALRAGFGSYAQFHRTFRQVCGESPANHFRWLDGAEVDAKRTLGNAAHPMSASP